MRRKVSVTEFIFQISVGRDRLGADFGNKKTASQSGARIAQRFALSPPLGFWCFYISQHLNNGQYTRVETNVKEYRVYKQKAPR